MSTNLEYRERERQRKGESGRQASEAQGKKKSDQELQREIKNKGVIFLLEEQHEHCSGGEIMRTASGHQGKNERQ